MSTEVAQCLAATLSPNTNNRIAAELRLSKLSEIPGAYATLSTNIKQHLTLVFAFSRTLSTLYAISGTGLTLAQLLVAQDAEVSLRQMSLSPIQYAVAAS